MTVTAPTVPVTALEILRSDGVEIEARLPRAAALREARDKAGPVGSSLWLATLGEVTEATLRFLGVDVGAVMLTGWGKYRELLDAAARTRGTADTAIVDLAGRDLVLEQSPSIEITWRDQVLASLEFVVSLDIKVQDVTAVVQDGALVEMTTGRCLVGVTVELNGEELAHAERQVDPHLAVRLGAGVRLGPDEGSPADGEANPGGART